MDKMREALDELEQYTYESHGGEYTLGEERPELFAAIRAALTPSAWISCAERLPTDLDADPYSKVWAERKGVIRLMPFFKVGDSAAQNWMPTGLTRPEPPEVKR